MRLAASLSRALHSNFLQASFLLFAAAMLANVSAFIFHAAASRLLGVSDYGSLYALMALLPLVSIPTTAFATVVTKFAAEFRAVHDDSHLHTLVARLSVWLAASVALAIVAGVALQSPVAAFLHVAPSAVAAGGLLVGVTLALPPLRAVLQGLEDFGRYTISAATEGVFKTGLGIVFAMLGWGVAGALFGYALGTGIALLYTWVSLRGMYAGAPQDELRLDYRRIMQTTAAALILITTITSLSYGDALIVKHFASPVDGGIYAAVSLAGKILLWVTSFIPLVVLPKAANRNAAGKPAISVFMAAAGMWAAVSAAGLLAFYFAPASIIRVLVGAQFLSAAPLMFEYALAMSLLAAMNVLASYKIALHRFDFAYPYCALTIAELGGISFYHPSLHAVITVLVIGNACGVLAGLYRIGSADGRNMPSTLRS